MTKPNFATTPSSAVKEEDEVKEKVDSAGRDEVSDATSDATEAVEEGVIEEVYEGLERA